MNFLFVFSEGSIFDLPLVLENMGHTVTIIDQCPFRVIDLEYTAPLAFVEAALLKQKYDYVISYDYITMVSDLCQRHNIPYISWIYDSPMATLFHDSIFNSVNRIFIFDYTLYERLCKIGIPHVYYMPLAANITRINTFGMSSEDREKYSCDISFVGSLYENNAYNEVRNRLPVEISVPITKYLMQNLCNWHNVRPWPILSDECSKYLINELHTDTTAINRFQIPRNMYLGLVFQAKKLAEMERITVLNTLAEQFSVDLYTGSKSDQIGILNVHPPVNYYTELGKVYHFSKINLNITLPSIESGIPLRIFDIMAYGGFVLSNYQQDFDRVFTPGKDLVVFHDLEEAKEQAAYYLSHEEERLKIAAHGYQTVNKYYSYQHQIQKILSICEQIALEQTGV